MKKKWKNQTLIRITELPCKFQKKNQRKHWFFNLIFFMINKTTGFRRTLTTNYLSTHLDAELMCAFITGFGLLQFWSVSSQYRYFGQSPKPKLANRQLLYFSKSGWWKTRRTEGRGSLYSSSFLKLCFPRDLSQIQHSTFSIKQEIMQASFLTTKRLCGPTKKFANNNKCIDPNNKFMLCQAWCCWRIYNSTNQTHTQTWFLVRFGSFHC
jgi:hypothetical protein